MDDGERRYWNEAVETKPLSQLIDDVQEILAKTDAFRRASKSSLYESKWNHGLVERGVRSFQDLQEFPYTSANAYSKAVIEHEHETLFCSDDIVIWHSTSGTSGEPKWFPQTPQDVETRNENRLRLNCIVNMRKKDRVFAVVAPPPFVSSVGPGWYWKELRGMGYEIETLMTSYYDVEPAVRFALKRKPTVIGGAPALIARLAEAIEERAGGMLKPTNLLPRLERGVFGGDFLEPYRRTIEEKFGIEAYDLLGLTESLFWGAECHSHNGIHMWIDQSILEIIPEGELEREEKEEGYIPKAKLIFEAKDDTAGELVLTEFGGALPLIRYRTADMIRLVSLDECDCGRTHPRIKVLGRVGNIISLGLVRLTEHDVDAAMGKVSDHGEIDRWQVRVSRVGFKPKPHFIVRPERVRDEEGLQEEVVQALYSQKKTLGEAVRLGVVERPEVTIDENLKEAMPGRTKIRRVFYDEDYAG